MNDDFGRRWPGRLVVDGVFFQRFVTGIARVWQEILLEWASQGVTSRIVIVDRARSAPRIAGYRYVDAPAFSDADHAIDRLRLGKICREAGATAFASTYFTIAADTPNLLLLHDMIPERCGFDMQLPMWQQKRRAIAAAAGFAAVSEHTLGDFRALYPEAASRPTVLAPNGVAARFVPPNAAEEKAFRDGFRAAALGGKPHLLFIGGGDGIKNGAMMRRALRGWKQRKRFSLLVTTAPPYAKDWLAELKDMTVHAAFLPEDGLRLAYGTAHCLLYPSLYEGFGLPIIEAMACGCPVICGNTASQPEIAGDAALLVDPRQPAKLVAALEELDHGDARLQLRAKGLARATSFTWARTVAALEDLLYRIAPP